MIQGFFSTPVDGISSSALDMEAIPDTFAIDTIEFTTVPEPQTFWLLTLGLGAILLRRSKSLKTQSG